MHKTRLQIGKYIVEVFYDRSFKNIVFVQCCWTILVVKGHLFYKIDYTLLSL